MALASEMQLVFMERLKPKYYMEMATARAAKVRHLVRKLPEVCSFESCHVLVFSG